MTRGSSYTQPEPVRSALLTIDAQRDFSDPNGASPIKGTTDCIPAMARALEVYRKQKLPIIHVIRLYEPGGANADLCRRATLEMGKQIVAPNSWGANLMSGLTQVADQELDSASLLSGKLQLIGEKEWVMYKPRWDGFHDTHLESHLRSLSVTTAVIVGCNFPNCPRATAYGASMRDFRVALLRDAVSGVYPRGLAELNNISIDTPKTNEWAERFLTT